MPNYIRPKSPGATIFFTVCLADRDSTLLVDEITRLREAFRVTMEERPFKIVSIVVLPEHLHCIWRLPEGDSAFSTRWRLIKSRFSMEFEKRPRKWSQRRRNERGLWQRRFWEHHVRGQEELNALIQYCWFNPVKHGLVEQPADWPYSSFHRDVRLRCVPSDWQGIDQEIDAGERAEFAQPGGDSVAPYA